MNNNGLKNGNPSVQQIVRRGHYKRVEMINVKSTKNKISVKKIKKYLKGLNFPQVEEIVANSLVNTIVEGIENGQRTVELTNVFNYDYIFQAQGEIFPKEPVQEILMKKIFKKVSETEDEIQIKMNWWCYII